MALKKEQIFSRDPKVVSGDLVFSGTRVPVRTLIEHLTAGQNLDEFLEGFPTVGRQQATAYLEMTLQDAEEEKLPADLKALLGRLSSELGELYGKRYRGLVLYGSYARGEADEGSDVDLLLLLEGEVDPARELRVADEVRWPLSLEGGYTLSLIPVSGSHFRNSGEPFLHNARTQGVILA